MLKIIFMNGLKDEVQAELKLHAISSFDELMDWALLLEEKNNALRKGREGKSTKETFKERWTFPKWECGGGKE